MRALQSFHHETPINFGAWFRLSLAERPLPWSWDAEDAALLLKWYGHFGWHRNLMAEDSTNSGAAAVLGVLLAQAYLYCFAGDGDNAVWKRLSQIMGVHETSFGPHVSRLSQRLGLYQDCKADGDLVHIYPFLKLVGCPQQALPPLGQQLRSSAPIRKRFRALVTAQWGLTAEENLKAWLREGRSVPSFLSPAEAELIQRVPEVKKDELGFTWTVFLLPHGLYQLTLLPTKNLSAGDWKGTTSQAVSSKDAQIYGIPQEVGRDGLIQGPGQSLEISWPNTPSFWTEIKPAPKGTKHAYQRTKGANPSLVCLPPQWSVDGDAEPGWRWVITKGQPTLFDPSGVPWQPRDESTAWDALEGISLQEMPQISVLHHLPLDLPGLEVRGGRLGSTLQEGVVWRNDGLGLPPLGHVHLSWTTRKGNRRQKEVYCLPTLQLTGSMGERPTVWIRGMEGLLGCEEEHRWFELDIEIKPRSWTSNLEFKGWGKQPISLKLEGPLNPWGAFLFGWKPHHPWPSHAPWNVGPRFSMDAYEANLRIEVALPPETEAKIWLDGIAPLWPDRQIKHQRRLGTLEFHEPLKPLWEVVEPLGRPIRLALAWTNPAAPEAEKLKSAPMLRFFPRDAALSVRAIGGWGVEVRSRGENPGNLNLDDWTLQIGSTKNPEPAQRWRLDELESQASTDGIRFTVPALDPTSGPYHIGLRKEDGGDHPINIHVDGHGKPISKVVEAHSRSVRSRMIGGVSIREDLPDFRDQLLGYAYDLAETHDLLDLLEPDEVLHWLDYLGDDFVFSQPWTLGIALRHPIMALSHIAGARWDEDRRIQAIGNLGQSGWSWWLVPSSELESMEPTLRETLLQTVSVVARRRITALHRISNAAVRADAISRICEEGIFLALDTPVRRLFLEQMGFPVDLMEQPWKAKNLSIRLCQQQDDFLGNLIQQIFQPNPEPIPLLSKPPVPGVPGLPPALDRLTRLSGWGRAYSQWVPEEDSSLICASSWSKATPEVFRHYGPLFTFFALLNWQD